MQKKHRIFIAFNLPEETKGLLAKYQQKYTDLPAQWTKRENLHVTMVFLGDLTDVELGEVCATTKQVAANHKSFELLLSSVGYGPDEKLPPRMLWAKGEKSQELSLLKQDLEDALLERVNFKPEHRTFNLHVTMAKISAFAWRAINPEERPEVENPIDATFTVESVDVMESELRKGGPVYTIIESIPLVDGE